MKRRNIDCGKLRRPMKRNKITEGMYGSTTVIYMKFLVLWAIVITADFMFMFRFEFLWPFWLLIRNAHDTYKYRGLAFSMLYVCIAITSDLVCLFFIPVNWLLFVASTYVWVQYVWHTDKGICLPTIFLWMLFVYLEAGIRWKDSRHMPHLDFCRPFAAHCIGYPVITMGCGIKTYIVYRIHRRKQREVMKENEFYIQLLQQALPQERTQDNISSGTSSTVTNTVNSLHPSHNVQNISTHNHMPTNVTSNDVTVKSNGSLPTAADHRHHNNNELHLHSLHNVGQIANNIKSTAVISMEVTKTTTSLQDTITVTTKNGANNANNIFDDKDCVQIGGVNGTSVSSCNSTSSSTAVNNNLQSLSNNNNHANNAQNHNHHNHTHQNHTHHNHTHHNHTQTNQHQQNYNSRNAQNNTLSNGQLGGSNKSSRRSDKENKNRDNTETNRQTKSNNSHQVLTESSRDKTDCDSNNYQIQQNSKLTQDDQRLNTSSSKKNQSHNPSSISSTTTTGIVTCEVEDIVEKNKGRRNRSKRDHISKDNHGQNQQNINNSTNNSNSNSHQHKNKDTSANQNHNNTNHNSDASSVSSSASSSSTTSTASTISNLASKVVSKICESCLKLEADVKKYRTEISHMKQIENELRQKLESNLTTKSCLQAKQKECDEYEKRIQELTNARHADMLQLQSVERRLTEERRQKQSLDSQLNVEKKARKLAEEKAARPECSIQCRQRKQAMEDKMDQMRRDLKSADEAKQLAEQHGRKWEQEVRMFEAEIRSRDSNQPDTEMLMNALAAMQDKHSTLEKNLSAETRVKLDLFSALGDAKRQLEISESRRRVKEDEVLDLKAKIAQLLAVMPNDPLCLPSCNTGGGAMLRMNETPPLQAGSSPASPMLNSLSAQQSPVPGNHQLTPRVVSNTVGEYVQQVPAEYVINQQQQKCVVPVSVAASVLVAIPCGSVNGLNNSNLDPNASVYTPKCGSGVIATNGVINGTGDA